MEFYELCVERFSARKYTDEKVGDDELNYILECAQMAPSAVNKQPWRFVIIESEEAKAKIRQVYDREWFTTAPIYILALKNNNEDWVRRYDGKHHGDIDVAIAVEHICLAATELQLGTCWVCAFDTDKMRELFPQPEGWEAVTIVPIGHIADDCPQNMKVRKPLADIVERI